MSFSQQFEGKVLVPWYNSFEWKYVCDILCRRNCDKYPKALEILKIWKLRVPFLPAGVEGTLILLEIMVQDTHISERHLIQIYSLSLVRFLNLTAANTEKQGMFNQTVTKTDLPKWLIDIRHDIAHNNKLPSKSVLKLALNHCFNWIIKKYWKVQNQTICDYVVTENKQDGKITEILGIYCEININLYYGKDMTAFNEALLQKINYYITKRHNSQSTDFYGILKIFEEMLTQSLETVECKKSAEDILSILASEKGLFVLINEVNFGELESIPDTFRRKWTNLLDILVNNGYLFDLLKKLHEITNDFLINDEVKKVSSLWMKAIFQELVNTKTKNQVSECSDLNSGIIHSFNSTLYEKIVLESANPYTFNYLKLLLKYNDNSEEEINGTFELVQSMVAGQQCLYKGEQLASIDEIGEPFAESIPTDFQNINIEEEITEPVQNMPTRSKWRVAAYNADFEGCPLGILPHQNRSRNPCIVFD